MAHELNILKVITHATASVGAASTQIMAANDRRLYAEIINSSNEGMWLKLGEAAVVGEGIYLAPSGFAFTITPVNGCADLCHSS
jgi:hypothetical protein